MKFKQKAGYMLFGCLFTIAGYILASLGSFTTNAQQNEQIIDKIVCRELEVVNKQGNRVITLDDYEDSGAISVYNNAGKTMVGIGTTENGDGGILVILNETEGIVAGIGTTENGDGILVVHNKEGKVVARIAADKDDTTENGDNGTIVVYNNADKEVVRITTDKDGNGVIQSYYKSGWRTH